MAAGTLNNAFDLFSQAARSSDRSAGGLGLGLALVKNLVDRHAGTVTGTARARTAAANSWSGCLCWRRRRRARPGRRRRRRPPAPALRLLIVDDNRDAAEMLGMELEAAGHGVDLVFNARTPSPGQPKSVPTSACWMSACPT